jgi:Heparinase II/III-like protein
MIDDGDIAVWIAEHDGYASLHPPARHRRSVLLDRASRSIDIIDQIEGGSHDVRLVFHLGPDVQAVLNGSYVVLYWPGSTLAEAGRLELPSALRWSLHRGETDPILGWYSPRLGRRVPAFTLVGSGRCMPAAPLATRLEFIEAGASPKAAVSPTSRITRWIEATGARMSSGLPQVPYRSVED